MLKKYKQLKVVNRIPAQDQKILPQKKKLWEEENNKEDERGN